MEETKVTEQTESIKEAKISESIPLDELKPGQLRIIKRNGKVVLFDVSKIEVAITKAFLAVEGGAAAAHARAKLCRARGEASGAQEGSGLEGDRVWAQLVVADQVGFPKCITIRQCPVLPRRAEARSWLALTYLGLCASGGGFIVYFFLLKRLSPVILSFVFIIFPGTKRHLAADFCL